jgi:hypothetical protein
VKAGGGGVGAVGGGGGEEDVASDAESLAESTASSEAPGMLAANSRLPQLATLSASLG